MRKSLVKRIIIGFIAIAVMLQPTGTYFVKAAQESINRTKNEYQTGNYRYIIDEKKNAVITGIKKRTGSHVIMPRTLNGYKVIGIKQYAFCDWPSLELIMLPQDVVYIEEFSFAWNPRLKAIVLPKSLTRIGKEAFKDCSSLENIYYGGNKTDWKKIKKEEFNSSFAAIKIYYNQYGVPTQKINGLPSKLTMVVGESNILRPNIKPSYTTDKRYFFSSNSKVATIDSKGKITARKKGSARITVKSGNKRVNIEVIVRKHSLKEKYKEKIAQIEKKYTALQKKVLEESDTLYRNVCRSYDDLKKQSVKKISRAIDSQLLSNLPKTANEAFVKVFTDTIQEKIIRNVSTYDDCKTAVQLVNKVAKQIQSEEGKFTFQDKKIVYTVSFNTIGVGGASYISGTISGQRGKRYHFGGTIIQKTSVEEYLKNLKYLSDKKIDEAKNAVYSDVEKILIPSKLKSFLWVTSKSKVYSNLKSVRPKLAIWVKQGMDMIDKFNNVSKAYGKLKDIDFTNDSEKDIIKKIAKYEGNVKVYMKAVEGLFN